MDRASYIKSFYNECAEKRDYWYRKNRYYHKGLLAYYNSLVFPESSVLELGCGTGELIGNLGVSLAVGVDISDKMLEVAKNKFPDVEFICADIEKLELHRKFDYIIISDTLCSVRDIQLLLIKISSMATSDTRFIVDYYNPLWNPILRFSEKLRMKMPEVYFNWLTLDDIENFFYISGYQVIKHEFLMLLPKYIPLFSSLVNKTLGKLPILRRLCVSNVTIARLKCPPDGVDDMSVSVVITCRDEEGNIQGLIERIPDMGKHTEIIFVEGHSVDKTVCKIQEMIEKYPEKDIKLFKQQGIGQRDAFRLGFEKAERDFIIWMEGDLTTPPEEARLFWEAYVMGKGEFINGSRLIYKMEKGSMPFFNFLGNRFLGNLFSIILKQRFSDTLCGFKAVSKKNYLIIMKQIDYFGELDPFGDFELIFGAVKNNLKVAEIPVHYEPRSYGESKAYGFSIFSFLKHAWLLLKMSWIAFKKFNIF